MQRDIRTAFRIATSLRALADRRRRRRLPGWLGWEDGHLRLQCFACSSLPPAIFMVTPNSLLLLLRLAQFTAHSIEGLLGAKRSSGARREGGGAGTVGTSSLKMPHGEGGGNGADE